MITLGSPANTTLDDDWTVVTLDGSLAAHWEHTVAVTETGPWVLTARDGGRAELGDELSLFSAIDLRHGSCAALRRADGGV
jgi:methionyl aminopeptidase